jgi:hypothetical protein
LLLNSSPRKSENPVRFPAGLARLDTSPDPNGSLAIKTIGIVVVLFFAARAAGTLTARITLALRLSSSSISQEIARSGPPPIARQE